MRLEVESSKNEAGERTYRIAKEHGNSDEPPGIRAAFSSPRTAGD